jgi:hypothetical protein
MYYIYKPDYGRDNYLYYSYGSWVEDPTVAEEMPYEAAQKIARRHGGSIARA